MKDIKVLIYADNQVMPTNEYSSILPSGYTTLLEQHRKTYAWIAEQVADLKPDMVVNLGDTIETQGFVDTLTLNVITEGLGKVAAVCKLLGIKHYQILGNHDIKTLKPLIHSLPQFPVVEDFLYLKKEDILFQSYTENFDAFKGRLEKKNPAWVFTHVDAKGSLLFKGLFGKGFDPRWLPSECTVFNGHHHVPHTMNNSIGQPVWINVGSCMYHNHKDKAVPDQPRGILLATLSKSQIGSRVECERIENPHTDILHTVEVDPDTPFTVPNTVIPSRTYLRVITPADMKESLLPLLEGYKGHKFIPIEIHQDSRKSAVVSTMDVEEAVTTYLKEYAQRDEFKHSVKDMLSLISPVIDELPEQTGSYGDLQFKLMEADGFMSLSKVRVKFDGDDLILVEGIELDMDGFTSNNVGKSALLEAISWVGFNRSLRGLKGADVINEKFVTEGVVVRLEFERNGKDYTIIRSYGHKDQGTGLQLWCGGVDISPRVTAPGKMEEKVDLAGTQAMVENALGLSYEELTHLVLIGGATDARFSQIPDAKKKELIELITDVKSYDLLEKTAKERVKAWTEGLGEIRGKLSQEQGKMELAETYLTQAKENLTVVDSWASQQQVVIDNELMVDKTSLADCQSKRESYVTALAQVDESIQSYDVYLASLVPVLAQLRTDREPFVVLLHSLTANKKAVTGLQAQCQCPVIPLECPYVADRKEELEALVCGYDVELETTKATLDAYDQSYQQYQEADSQGRSALQGFQTQRQTLHQYISTVDSQVVRLNGNIASLGERRAGLSMKKKELQDAVAAHKRSVVEIEKSAHRIDADVQRFEENLSQWTSWVSIFHPSNLRTAILQDAIKELNEHALHHSNEFSSGGMLVQLSSEKQLKTTVQAKYDILINGSARAYVKKSFGTKTRIDTIIQLAIREARFGRKGRINLLAVDEVDQGLDVGGTQRFVDLLRAQAGTVIVMTHGEVLKSLIQKRWVLTKQNHKATLEVIE